MLETTTLLQIDYDPALPITARREEILAALSEHQVVVVAGETGSGKSTQLPKLCLEAGRGQGRLIGCTQPRRIAARSVARRVAAELKTQIGELIGYQVRFTARTARHTRVKFMTDGILLAEIRRDRLLRQYDTLIIDEAHERSLNIDFLLGYLKYILPRRPDLRLVITSATIDTEKFSAAFGGAPVIEVSGRGYPVEMRYRPLIDADGDLNCGIARAVQELSRHDPRGDILVFLPGEAEIFAAARELRHRNLPHTEILPLYARLPAAAQDQVFQPGRVRRIVLATNVAETSLTVPGIRYVIDSGLARISRYASHSKVLRLPIEPVSQASCNQRAGRCGRTAPGICIRLFDEDDYQARVQFTEPEVLRTPLASTVLALLELGLGEPEAFGFIDAPPPRLFKEAWQTLFELGAVDADRNLTAIGRQLARLPVDVRHGRMLLEGARRGCLAEVLVLAAALGIADPRERPADQQQAADQAHAQFADTDSDFTGLLKLWRWWQKTLADHTRNQAEKLARRHFLSPARLREWRNLHGQLKDLAGTQEKTGAARAEAEDSIHRALLSGLIAHVGQHVEAGEYIGARGHKFRIHPGSVLFKRQPGWIMAGELVETSRPYARMVAPLKPEWLEAQAAHLLRSRVFDPYWDRRSGRVMGYEQVSLFGLVLVEKRRTHYGPHDPKAARRLFIRHALVRGEVHLEAEFIKYNKELRDEFAEQEHKRRRHDVLAGEGSLEAFFAERLPADIYTLKAFGRWFDSLDESERARLLYDRAVLLRPGADQAAENQYPDRLESGGESFALEYRFEPGHAQDGVTLICPLHLLNRLDTARLEWLVPGLLEEKVTALIGTLPKSLRRSLVPAAEYARAALEAVAPNRGALAAALARELSRIAGLDIAASRFDPSRLPAHLHMNIRVLDDKRRVLAQGRDLTALQQQLGQRARREFMHRQGSEFQRDGLTAWDFGALPETATTPAGHRAWPALVDQGEVAGMRSFDDPFDAAESHRQGLARLLRLVLRDKFRYLENNTGLDRRAQLIWAPIGDVEALAAELRASALHAHLDDAWAVRDAEAFSVKAHQLRVELVADYSRLAKLLGAILHNWRELRVLLTETDERYPEATTDIQAQLDDLIYAGFVRDVPAERLAEYPRYLEAAGVRVARLRENPGRDRQRQAQVAPWWQRYTDHLETYGWYSNAVDAYRWLLEEYRVQVFAQELGTRGKVSAKRLEQAWLAVERERHEE